MSGPNPEVAIGENLDVNPYMEDWSKTALPAALQQHLAGLEQSQVGLCAVLKLLTADEKLGLAANTWAGFDYCAFDEETRHGLISAADVLSRDVTRAMRRVRKAAGKGESEEGAQ